MDDPVVKDPHCHEGFLGEACGDPSSPQPRKPGVFSWKWGAGLSPPGRCLLTVCESSLPIGLARLCTWKHSPSLGNVKSGKSLTRHSAEEAQGVGVCS